MHESILVYRKLRYVWIAAAVTIASIAAYIWHDPQEPPNGGTILGYTLGTVAALLIVWLTWFGVRKRRYASTMGSVQGWLSAHVYLGLAVPVIVLLHAGFQLGLNVHTFAFVLMLLVVVSGLYGVYVYTSFPDRVSNNRGGVSREELFEQLAELDRRSKRVAAKLDDNCRELVQSGISRTELGGTRWARLRRRDNSKVVLPGATSAVDNRGQEAALDWLAERQSRATDAEAAASIGELSALLRNKRKLLKQLREDLRLQAGLEIWLYAHVPLTAGLLVALVAHILSVFLYW